MPQILFPNASNNIINVSINEIAGVVVGQVIAYDPDNGENGTLVYSLQHGYNAAHEQRVSLASLFEVDDGGRVMISRQLKGPLKNYIRLGGQGSQASSGPGGYGSKGGSGASGYGSQGNLGADRPMSFEGNIIALSVLVADKGNPPKEATEMLYLRLIDSGARFDHSVYGETTPVVEASFFGGIMRIGRNTVLILIVIIVTLICLILITTTLLCLRYLDNREREGYVPPPSKMVATPQSTEHLHSPVHTNAIIPCTDRMGSIRSSHRSPLSNKALLTQCPMQKFQTLAMVDAKSMISSTKVDYNANVCSSQLSQLSQSQITFPFPNYPLPPQSRTPKHFNKANTLNASGQIIVFSQNSPLISESADGSKRTCFTSIASPNSCGMKPSNDDDDPYSDAQAISKSPTGGAIQYRSASLSSFKGNRVRNEQGEKCLHANCL